MQRKNFCHYCATKLSEKFVEGQIRLFCENCNIPIYENPVPATCTIVINDQEKVLLVKRSVAPKIGFWCLPGGFIELGENPESAALRELREETGLSGSINNLMGLTSHPSPLYDTVLIAGYLVKAFSGSLNPGDDASDAGFFNIDKLPELAFESHLQFIMTYYDNVMIKSS